jgi:hypothetical protein
VLVSVIQSPSPQAIRDLVLGVVRLLLGRR